MQVTETVSDGLKRQLKVVVPAADLKVKVESKLADLTTKVKLNGFRPGKVPMAHVRQLYGRSVLAEVLEETVGESSMKVLEERKERPAFQPDIKLPEDKDVIERMLDGTGDLEYTMAFEVLPKIELTDLKAITLTKDVADPKEEDVKGAIDRLLKANVAYETKEGAAEAGDRLTIDFKGSIDGEPFEGGAAEDAFLVLGSGRFIPGFEDGLIGAKKDDQRDVKVTFPEDYQAPHLAGKDAVFDVTVKDVSKPVDAKADDEFAKTLGLESFAKLEDAVRGQLRKELDDASRAKLKKALLDALDERHAVELPPSLVTSEFDGIWRGITRQLEQAKKTFEDEGSTEEKARAEYQKLAERRVRLGLVLSEIGNQNEIKILDDELRRAMIDRARQFPGQEREVIEFYRKNPQALNELRAPVYEDKVITFVLELVKTEENKVSPEDLMKSLAELEREQSLFDGGIEEEHEHVHGPDCDHDHDHDHAGHKHG
ncbi:trigger factor [Rhodomicrobium udaipurense JA643]|uniref:Trigger factor n=1 Tax=Rhodomicrobium udaipurense TaxID=1202716 RepID=A0A8I1GGC4_9HYPH|nr:trigger factor [Rhodomicrobium udaipurense]KAI95892.1 trigger factor [Rhodomicrobium udaipurense JA643]MBJ7542840.1 trigger factor [Rhodomicrobium udaipurense]